MNLAGLMARYPTELRADLQRFYGLDVETCESAGLLAACAACLPHGSFTLARINPAAGWGITDYKLHEIACMLAGRVLPFPWDRKEAEYEPLPEFGSVPVEDMEAWLGQEWIEVEDGRRDYR